MKAKRIIAVDFDGCLCSESYPDIGEPNYKVIAKLKKAQKDGAKLILWTCRECEPLEEAVEWCKHEGLIFDAVNENLPEEIARWGNNPRKIGATEYWDDRAVNVKHKSDNER